MDKKSHRRLISFFHFFIFSFLFLIFAPDKLNFQQIMDDYPADNYEK